MGKISTVSFTALIRVGPTTGRGTGGLPAGHIPAVGKSSNRIVQVVVPAVGVAGLVGAVHEAVAVPTL